MTEERSPLGRTSSQALEDVEEAFDCLRARMLEGGETGDAVEALHLSLECLVLRARIERRVRPRCGFRASSFVYHDAAAASAGPTIH